MTLGHVPKLLHDTARSSNLTSRSFIIHSSPTMAVAHRPPHEIQSANEVLGLMMSLWKMVRSDEWTVRKACTQSRLAHTTTTSSPKGCIESPPTQGCEQAQPPPSLTSDNTSFLQPSPALSRGTFCMCHKATAAKTTRAHCNWQQKASFHPNRRWLTRQAWPRQSALRHTILLYTELQASAKKNESTQILDASLKNQLSILAGYP